VRWSHLQRDFRRHADGLGEQKTFCEHGLKLTGRVFVAWRAYQHEHHDRDRLETEIDGVEPTNNPAERALRSPVIHRKSGLAPKARTVSDSPNGLSRPPATTDFSAAHRSPTSAT
jgi:hypothetical protein